MSGLRFPVSVLAVMVATSPFATLHAQSVENGPSGQTPASADDASKPATPGEIVVTATKRNVRLSDVPAAVSVVTDEVLKSKSADSFVQYARSVPGLSFTDIGAGRQRLSIRGIDSKVGSQVVGYYIGETPIPGSRGTIPQTVADPRLYDIARIEVLRGPQGTLYGSGSMGGTVKIVPKRPNLDEFGAELDVTGSFTPSNGANPGFGANVMANVPIVDGSVAVRMVGWVRSEDGFITREVNGVPVKHGVPHENTYGVRGTLDAKLDDRWTVSLSAFYQRQSFNGFQDITTGAANPNDALVQNFRSDTPERNSNTFQLYNFLIEGDLDFAKLVSSTSYYYGNMQAKEETSETLFYSFGIDGAGAINEASINKDFSEELRLTSSRPLAGFDYIIGLYFNRNRGQRNNDYTIPGFSEEFFPVLGDNLYASRMRYTTHQTAVFGEISREIVPGLKLTGGLRWFNARNTSSEPQNGLFAGAESATPPTAADAPVLVGESKGLIYKFNASYKASDQFLLYGTASEGFRPGMAQAAIPELLCSADLQALGISNTPRQLNSDKLWNYEVGFKSSTADRKAQLNVAAYQIDWSHIQQSVFLPCGYRVFVNGPDVRNRGIEAEVNLYPVTGLSLGGTISYIDSQFQSELLGIAGTKGKPVPDTPKWTLSAYADYTMALSGGWDGSLRIDYSHTDGSISSYTSGGDFTFDKGSLDLVDLRLGLKREHYQFALFVRNLLNDVERTALSDSLSANIPYRLRYSVNRPRTFGMNITFTY